MNKFPGYYLPPEIKSMLDRAKHQVIEKDWDRVYIIDGEEGSGKSLFGLQLGYYLDPTLNLDRITFSGKTFAKAIEQSEKNKCIIFDEAFNGLDSTGAMSNLNRLVVRKLMECRQKNLYLIIILPTIFLLQKYAAIFRSKCLFHIYATTKGTRGYYRVYNKQNKKMLYLIGKKFYSYSKPYIKKSYVFRGKYPIDKESYLNKKLEVLEEREEEKINKYYFMFGLMCKILKEKYKMTYVEQSKILKANGLPIDDGHIPRVIAKIPSKEQLVRSVIYK